MSRRSGSIDTVVRLVESVRTTRDATQLRKRALKAGVAGLAVCGAFALTNLASGATSFADTVGDDNAAPDITSVQVSASGDAFVTLVVAIRNYAALPTDSWFNVWFDDDSDDSTGYGGDETLVRYIAGGQLELYKWDGIAMLKKPIPAGLMGGFAEGVLTLTVPTSDLGGDSSFGVLAISSLRQRFVVNQFTASDFAPDRGRAVYSGPARATFEDAENDEDAAPDIAGLQVSDTREGWIRLAISTPNYATLKSDAAVWLAIDSDNRAATSDIDAAPELQIRYLDGIASLERWQPRNGGWVEDRAPDLVRGSNSRNVVTIELRRSAVGSAKRFGFSVTTADFDPEGTVRALDVAPDSGGFYRYVFANRAAFVLVASLPLATPSQPRAGESFAVSLPVRRSDTGRAITSGRVSCAVVLGGAPLRATGAVQRGAGRCALVLPRSAAGQRLRGTIRVSVGGRSVSGRFSYLVR